MNGAPWTPQESAEALAMRAKGVRLKEISRKLGRSYAAVEKHVHGRRDQFTYVPPKPDEARPTPKMWFDRDRRLGASLTPNMIVLGDPSPERSALGKRNNQST